MDIRKEKNIEDELFILSSTLDTQMSVQDYQGVKETTKKMIVLINQEKEKGQE